MYFMEEKTISSKYVYRGNILDLRIDEVFLPGGKTTSREIIEHSGAAAAVPFVEPGKLLLVKQFRKPAGKILLEIPAGRLKRGESPAECAARELEEETGWLASSVEKLIDFYPSPGYSDEIISIFRAAGLKRSEQKTEPDEFIEVIEIDFHEAAGMILEGKITDGKTIAGILAAGIMMTA